ncbi:MAG: hypothetical protein NVS4B3_07960 [Gemmatimonadaceae bacterium]
MRAGVRVGIITAAGTSGVLAGFGLRRGTVALHFDALGGALLPGTGFPDARATVAGVALHVVVVVGWTMGFTAAARRARGGRLAVAALCYAAVVYFLNAHLLSAPLRLGFAGAVSPGEVLAFYIAFAGSLFGGMRLAL